MSKSNRKTLFILYSCLVFSTFINNEHLLEDRAPQLLRYILIVTQIENTTAKIDIMTQTETRQKTAEEAGLVLLQQKWRRTSFPEQQHHIIERATARDSKSSSKKTKKTKKKKTKTIKTKMPELIQKKRARKTANPQPFPHRREANAPPQANQATLPTPPSTPRTRPPSTPPTSTTRIPRSHPTPEQLDAMERSLAREKEIQIASITAIDKGNTTVRRNTAGIIKITRKNSSNEEKFRRTCWYVQMWVVY